MTSNPPPPKAGQAQTAEDWHEADMKAFFQAHEAFHASQNKHTQFEHTAAATIGAHRSRAVALSHSSLLASHERLKQALERVIACIDSGHEMHTRKKVNYSASFTDAKIVASAALKEAHQ